MSKQNLYAVAVMVCKPDGTVAAAKLIQRIAQEIALTSTTAGGSFNQGFLLGSWAVLAASEEEAKQLALGVLYERYPVIDGWLWYSAQVCQVERELLEEALSNLTDEEGAARLLHSDAVM